jgi:hypothetical protein
MVIFSGGLEIQFLGLPLRIDKANNKDMSLLFGIHEGNESGEYPHSCASSSPSPSDSYYSPSHVKLNVILATGAVS